LSADKEDWPLTTATACPGVYDCCIRTSTSFFHSLALQQHSCVVVVRPARYVSRLQCRLQLSTIIRDLSLHCRAAKIAGCRLRGQEIMAATTSGSASLFVGGKTMCQNAFDFYTDDDMRDVTS